MNHTSITFVPLLLVIGLAFLVPLLLSRLRGLSIVIGEVLAGIAVGESGLGMVSETLEARDIKARYLASGRHVGRRILDLADREA